MNIITHRMTRNLDLTSKAVLSRNNSICPACKFWMPMDEGSGTTLTDVVGGANLATATNAWDGAYHQGADSNEASAAAMPAIDADTSFIFVTAIRHTGGVADITRIGTSSGARFLASAGTVYGDPGVVIGGEDDDGTELTAPVLTGFTSESGDTIGLALIVDRTENTVTFYAKNGTTIVTEVAAEDATEFGAVQPGSQVTQQNDCAGIALFAFSEGIPGDHMDILNDLIDDWHNDIKLLPADWVSLV